MIRFIIRRKYRSSANGLETDEMETVDIAVPELERILRGGDSGENGYDYRTVAGVELLADSAPDQRGMITGLELALDLIPKPNSTTQWDPQEAIQAEIERLRALTAAGSSAATPRP